VEFLSLNGATAFPANLFPPGYSSQNSNVSVLDLSDPSIPYMNVGIFGIIHSRQIQAVDQLSYTRGSHQFKFGVDYKSFRIFSQPPRTSLMYGFEDLPKGQVTDLIEEVTPSNVAYKLPAFSLYAQDTWHALRNLTATFGLRWEVEPAPRATTGDVSVYHVASLAEGSSLTAAPPDSPFFQTRYTNLAPRIGLAWQLRNGANKTVLRVGTGIFYDSAGSEFASASASTTNIYVYSFFPFRCLPHWGSAHLQFGVRRGRSARLYAPENVPVERYDGTIVWPPDILGGLHRRHRTPVARDVSGFSAQSTLGGADLGELLQFVLPCAAVAIQP